MPSHRLRWQALHLYRCQRACRPSPVADRLSPPEMARLNKELSDLEPLVEALHQLRALREEVGRAGQPHLPAPQRGRASSGTSPSPRAFPMRRTTSCRAVHGGLKNPFPPCAGALQG